MEAKNVLATQVVDVKKSRQKANDIGRIPDPVSPERREACRYNFKLFCETYGEGTFYLDWSADHLVAIRLIEKVVLDNSRYAWAMPRGAGKTALARFGGMWAILYGHKRYIVIIGSDSTAATNILSSIKTTFETPGIVADDFPEVCYPLVCLEGKSQATHSQTSEGAQTKISWTATKIVLPTVEGSQASGSIIQGFGITGGLRGGFHVRLDVVTGLLVTLRPDMAVNDDPQTDESAASPLQCERREKLITGAILRMSGPGVKMAAMMPCTIIVKYDLAWRILQRDRNPIWRGTITKMLPTMPVNLDFWDVEYRAVWERDLLNEDSNGDEVNLFYLQHRAKLEEGCTCSWPQRVEGNDMTAIQSAMHFWLEDRAVFMAEYQNEPDDEHGTGGNMLELAELEKRCTNININTIPTYCNRLVAYIDVGSKSGVHYTLLGIGEGFIGSVVDFGKLNVSKNKSIALEARVIKAINTAIEECYKPRMIDGSSITMQVELICIDSGWLTDTVYRIVREHVLSPILRACKGEGVKPGGELFRSKDKTAQVGNAWIYHPVKTSIRPVRLLRYNTNYWKTFAFNRANVEVGSPSSIVFPGKPEGMSTYFDHLTSEYRELIKVDGKDYDRWALVPNNENHYFDTFVGCCMAGNYLGVGLAGKSEQSPKRQGRTPKTFKRNR